MMKSFLFIPMSFVFICLFSEYPSMIEQWTKDDVKSFLIENQFNCLLPVLSDMNGCLLK